MTRSALSPSRRQRSLRTGGNAPSNSEFWGALAAARWFRLLAKTELLIPPVFRLAAASEQRREQYDPYGGRIHSPRTGGSSIGGTRRPRRGANTGI